VGIIVIILGRMIYVAGVAKNGENNQMCLIITEESKIKTTRIKRKREDIVAYKVVTVDYESPFYRDFVWSKNGTVLSGRKSARRTNRENRAMEIHSGVHLITERPEVVNGKLACPCPYPCLCPYYIVLKIRVRAEDLIAVGMWNVERSMVVTKCEVLGVVNE